MNLFKSGYDQMKNVSPRKVMAMGGKIDPNGPTADKATEAGKGSKYEKETNKK